MRSLRGSWGNGSFAPPGAAGRGFSSEARDHSMRCEGKEVAPYLAPSSSQERSASGPALSSLTLPSRRVTMRRV